jgi:D-serine dehydratase
VTAHFNSFLDGLAATTIDDGVRGVPPGAGSLRLGDVAGQGWRPERGDMPLPVLTLDEAAYAGNRDLIFAYARDKGVALAPHAKTPMAPQIVADLIAAGAWGATVANLQQAAVMARAGVRRLLLANAIGGRVSGRHLGDLIAAHSDIEWHCFADSPAGVAALTAAAERAGRPLSVLVEVGTGRGGARDAAAVEAVIHAIGQSKGRLVLGGVATYEGAAAVADPAETRRAIATLMQRTAEAFAQVRAVVPSGPLIVSAGGSAFFDEVVSALKPVVAADGQALLLLRGGAILFHDHGVYERALAQLDARAGFAVDGKVRSAASAFTPALRLWAEVLSRPEPGLAICGFGMRDVSFDQDLPRPLAAYREGVSLMTFSGDDGRIAKLNDQHAFLALPTTSPIAVGDIIALGISHPCTCLDRWRVFFGLDEAGEVRTAYRTFFG